ncbi:sodium-dependent dopamine transporter-like isoform X1 [Haliotis rufescens]|uniref:sodium-dependent dopamine transporter-like isoform X1 n=1 Tax=Haliotis rufescens TaxID=6454 RepID=UPI00201F82F3|nr:sodium-dependent dopamine transporter-like isoform X1 [Haliotis rufescens]XP_046350044.2 sodium-dependent dopamine transporter-like isoform X1 [Haliotis rufescens]
MAHEHWRSQLDYLITLLGYGVGSGSFVRFPFYCIRNGGGAFLLLFMFFTIIGAIPCVFLEMTIGQFSQSGPIKVWNMCPAFKGIGVGSVVVTWIFVSYYNVNFSWFMYYFYYSFTPNLPWDHCDNAWNTPACIHNKNVSAVSNDTTSNTTDVGYSINGTVRGMTAAEEFWKFQMLGQSDGLDNLGGLRWHLVGCLAVTTVLLFVWIFQGIKVSGKLVYITVAVPYILIFIFLIRGCLLPGSAEGIYFYIYPKFDKLTDPKVWIESCRYALASMGIAFGCIITMSGHNRIDNNCFRDAIIICLMDSLSNVFFGFAFFSIVGHVAFQRGVTVEAFQSSGYDLPFIVYPEVVSALPLPQLWSVLTFVTLMSLGIDSVVPSVEIVVAALEDMLPPSKWRRWLIIGSVLLSLFLFGLIFTSQGGIFVVTLFDWYAYFPSTAVLGILECIAVGWCYGIKRLQADVRIMWGKTIPRVMVICFKFVCPIFLVVICCYSLYSYRPPQYHDYIYPTWATAVGWLIAFSSLLPLPAVFIWTVYNTQGATLKEKVKKTLEPNEYWRRSPPEEEFTEVLQPIVEPAKSSA